MKGFGSTVVSEVGVVTDVDAIVELTGVFVGLFAEPFVSAKTFTFTLAVLNSYLCKTL